LGRSESTFELENEFMQHLDPLPCDEFEKKYSIIKASAPIGTLGVEARYNFRMQMILSSI